jgi:TPR repeat protein
MKNFFKEFAVIPAICLLGIVSCRQERTVSVELRTLPLAELRKLSEQGDPQAQTLLGHRYFYGQGVSMDQVEGCRWYRKAAEQGSAEAQCFVGFCYGVGDGVAQDVKEADRWNRRSANQGWPQGQMRIGLNYFFGHGASNVVDLVEAYKWLHLAATGGYQIDDFYASAAARQYIQQLRQRMKPEQIEEAKRRARDFRPVKER